MPERPEGRQLRIVLGAVSSEEIVPHGGSWEQADNSMRGILGAVGGGGRLSEIAGHFAGGRTGWATGVRKFRRHGRARCRPGRPDQTLGDSQGLG